MSNPVQSPIDGSRKSLSGYWIVVGLVLVILSPLAAIPLATFPTNQPWRVEFWSSILLVTLTVAAFWRKDEAGSPDSILRPIFAAIGLFVLWSLISALWAQS